MTRRAAARPRAPSPWTTLSTPGGRSSLAELAEERGRRRRVLGRLQHRGVAAEDRREHLPGVVRQRRVERDDQRRQRRRDAASPSPCGSASPTSSCVRRGAALRPRRRSPSRPRRRPRRARARATCPSPRRRSSASLLASRLQRERELAHELAALDRRPRRPLTAGPLRAAATAAATSASSERGDRARAASRRPAAASRSVRPPAASDRRPSMRFPISEPTDPERTLTGR